MQLHILGPAFGLPSIDPDCIAAVAILKTYCEKHNQSWELIPAHDNVGGSSFPVLYDGSATVRGYRNIVKHLGEDVELTEQQKADHHA